MLPQEILNIENLLIEFLGESKNGISEDGQIQFGCPRCIDEKGPEEASKYNLEVNLFRMVYHCWSCSTTEDDMKGPLSRLIKQYGNHSIYLRYKEEIESLKKSKEYDLGLFKDIYLDDIERIVLHLPSSYRKIDLATCNNRKVVEYCEKRRLTQDVIDRFNLGYTDNTDTDYGWRNRIIIPSYDKYDELNYIVGRDYTGKSPMKYKNCDIKKTDVIFQESLINWDADIILVEGAIDCLRFPNTISLLGKELLIDSELNKALHLRSNGHIIIAIDGDTKESEIMKIYKSLDWNSLKGKIRYIDMSKASRFKDFSEAYEYGGRKEIMRIMRHAKSFSEFELNIKN